MQPRQQPGGRSTDPADYPVGKSAYALRSVDALLDCARQRGHHIGRFAETLLGGPLPWTQMRAAYALLALCDKYTDGRVEAVCQSALSFDVIDVRRIGRMLKLAIAKPADTGGNVVSYRCPYHASLATSSTFARAAAPTATRGQHEHARLAGAGCRSATAAPRPHPRHTA